MPFSHHLSIGGGGILCYSFIFSSEKVLIGEVVDKVIEGGGQGGRGGTILYLSQVTIHKY